MWKNLVIFLALFWSGALCDQDVELDVVVSKGMMVELVPGVTLYTEEQAVTFFIPDLPDLPTLVSTNCVERPYTEACSVTEKLNDINTDSLLLLSLMNRMLTKSGLSETDIEEEISQGIDSTNEDVSDKVNGPSEKFVLAAGTVWYKLLRQRLNLRKVNNNDDSRSQRTVRSPFVQQTIKGITGIAALFGIDDLFSVFGNLFVSKDKILNILSSMKAYMPVDRQAFAEVVRKTSEFESFAKEKFADITNDNNDLKNLTNFIDEEVRRHRMDISVMQEGYTQTQRVLADTTSLLFTSILYIVQINAFTTCRSKELPLVYVPPSLLLQTLAKLEESLAEDIEFAIPKQKSGLYYTLSDMCTCLYDDDGGTIRLTIPLRQRGAILQLYEVRPLQFAWQKQTCVLQIDGSFVVTNKRTGFVYPVTAVDDANCDPVTKKQCKVPASTADDITSSCVSVILGGGATEEIKAACPISCSSHSPPEVAKVSDSIFVGTHIQANTLTVECPMENRTITELVEYGALLIKTPCSCSLRLDGKLIGRSTKDVCDPTDVLKIETILPAHFITSKDIVHFTDGEMDAPRYRHKDEIFDEDFLIQNQPNKEDNGLVTTKVNIYSVMWNFVQSTLLAYSFFRIHTMGGLLYQLTNSMPGAAASNNHKCNLPDDAYILLIIILAFTIIGVVPQIFFCVWTFIKTAFWDTVEIEAKRMNLNSKIENYEMHDKPVAPMISVKSRKHSVSSNESDCDYRHTTRF